MLTGAEFGKALLPLSGIARENFILKVARDQGLVPFHWTTIRSEQLIAGKTRVLEMDVANLPAAIGTPDDPFFFQAWPWTYQALANDLKLVLPTRLIILIRAKAAKIRIEPRPFSASDGGKMNESSARFIESNQAALKDIASLMASGLWSPDKIVEGLGKAVVIGPNMDGSKVAIFGWFHAKPAIADTDVSRWQSYPGPHEATYGPDYAHKWFPAKEMGRLDGSPVLLTHVAQDKLLWPLVTDQGPFALHFPNAAKSVSPPPGYPPGTFFITPPSKLASKVGTAAGVVGGVALGGAVGFAVGGPVGALAGAMLGAALGRA